MSKKVLLVDDSDTALMMERMILNRTPYQLMTAKNGADAIRTATTELPDLILMDVVMPGIDGFEACRELKAQRITCHIPIIMVTTRSEVQNVEAGYESGCNGYVTKPIDGADLVGKLKALLGE
jgi:CheY-like chemotaxis protein